MHSTRTTRSCPAAFGRFALTLALGSLTPWAAFASNVVFVPAGSVDAIPDAIAEAGRNGTVLLESGTHYHAGTITVDIPVSIIGDEGTVLEVTIAPTDDIAPAIHIFEADGTIIEGITLVPAVPGDEGIVIQDSSHVTIRDNAIADFRNGIFIQGGDYASIEDNLLEDMRIGAIVLNGTHVRFTGNTVRGMELHGFWLGDAKGQCTGNSTSDTFIGILLCHLTREFVWPDGSVGGGELPATDWHVANNEVRDSFIGIYAVDGARSNVINNNDVAATELVDILLESELEEDDVFYPGSYDNTVTLGSFRNVTVWDFGIGNRVLDGND